MVHDKAKLIKPKKIEPNLNEMKIESKIKIHSNLKALIYIQTQGKRIYL